MGRSTAGAVVAILVAAAALTGCGGSGATPSASPGPSARTPAESAAGTSVSPAPSTGGSPQASASDAVEPAFTPVPDASQAPDSGTGAAAGDVPDNAVFLTYRSAAWQFSIQYVEGWQVTTLQDGVGIRDKDSSEQVSIVQKPADVAAWIASTDLPALRAQPGFSLVKQNRVKVGGATLIHLLYHARSAADPVTGKQVPSTVDRFYVPGPGLAVITLSTPDGVDNVDAFRQMIGSFAWTK